MDYVAAAVSGPSDEQKRLMKVMTSRGGKGFLRLPAAAKRACVTSRRVEQHQLSPKT